MLTLKELLEAGNTLTKNAAIARRALDRLKATDAHAQAALDRLVAQDEGLRRLLKLDPKQSKALLADLVAERKTERVPAASVAYYRLTRTEAIEADLREFVAHTRKDVRRTWSDADTTGLTPDGMVMLAVLQEQINATRGPVLRAAPPSVRLKAYREAIANRSDPRSRIVGELIEAIAEEGTRAPGPAANTPAEIEEARKLRDVVEYFQSNRVPAEVAEVAEAIEAARKMQTAFSRAEVKPLNADHDHIAGGAYARELVNEVE